jgi:hypothetical protein
MGRTHYEILDIKKAATPREIKIAAKNQINQIKLAFGQLTASKQPSDIEQRMALRKLGLKVTEIGNTAKIKATEQSQIVEIKTALSVLSDPKKRHAYDVSLVPPVETPTGTENMICLECDTFQEKSSVCKNCGSIIDMRIKQLTAEDKVDIAKSSSNRKYFLIGIFFIIALVFFATNKPETNPQPNEDQQTDTPKTETGNKTTTTCEYKYSIERGETKTFPHQLKVPLSPEKLEDLTYAHHISQDQLDGLEISVPYVKLESYFYLVWIIEIPTHLIDVFESNTIDAEKTTCSLFPVEDSTDAILTLNDQSAYQTGLMDENQATTLLAKCLAENEKIYSVSISSPSLWDDVSVDDLQHVESGEGTLIHIEIEVSLPNDYDLGDFIAKGVTLVSNRNGPSIPVLLKNQDGDQKSDRYFVVIGENNSSHCK